MNHIDVPIYNHDPYVDRSLPYALSHQNCPPALTLAGFPSFSILPINPREVSQVERPSGSIGF